MGGATSLVAVGEGKVEARALVLVDMAPKIEAQGRREIQAFMNQKPEGFDSLEEVAEAIANYQPHRKRPTHARWAGQEHPAGQGRQVSLALGPGAPACVARG